MPKSSRIKRIENLIWTLIYGGLLTLVLGLATRGAWPALAWVCIVLGAVAAAAGFALIPWRARLPDE